MAEQPGTIPLIAAFSGGNGFWAHFSLPGERGTILDDCLRSNPPLLFTIVVMLRAFVKATFSNRKYENIINAKTKKIPEWSKAPR
jgi:hypothetical protein